MNPFIKEILISTVGVFVGIIVLMAGITIFLYIFEDILIGKDKSLAIVFMFLYFLAVPVGGFFGNKYAMKWFVD